ncbi:MAG: cryptochrome/photolyase family protein [Planctomycetota bacterium]|nr:cryptochrome/photolyase family protein [Planctomycetota bacterium]
MSAFRDALAEQRVEREGRRWVFVAYDQLSDGVGPLAREPARELGIVLVESSWKAAQRPYHKQKLAFVLANMRHFALEQARRGVAVEYVMTDQPYRDALRPVLTELGGARVMEPAERELRTELEPLVAEELLEVVPHEGWLTTPEDFDALGDAPWRMDAFYRRVRQRTGILMDGGKPTGGKYSFDAENRKPWKGEPPAPEPPRFRPDAITREVGELVETRFGEHPGTLDLRTIPATKRAAQRQWRWALQQCLMHFGPYEDAMSVRSTGLFHTRISALLNVQRLTARDVLADVLEAQLPLASQEGFVRQLLGWREFVRHVHGATDGFRRIAGRAVRDDGSGARPNHLGSRTPLPAAFWGTPSGLHCLDRVVADVWEEGYSHHITRLMVLSNLATLLDIEPRELTDWFWVAYTDAFDWVVEPNVLAMGTYGTGPLMTTKPYVSGAAYIDRMSDYCGSCRFDPKKDCPVTRMYWAFLARKAKHLEGNIRIAMPLRSLAKRSDEKKREDARVYRAVRKALEAGEAYAP